MASPMMTCARRRALCRLSSTASAAGFVHFSRMKFMDRVISSPKTAERKLSIWEITLAPQEDNTARWVRKHTVSFDVAETVYSMLLMKIPRRTRDFKNNSGQK
jgi:hypothetical protein